MRGLVQIVDWRFRGGTVEAISDQKKEIRLWNIMKEDRAGSDGSRRKERGGVVGANHEQWRKKVKADW